MKFLMKTLAALSIAGTAITPAFASRTEPMTVRVEYGDINLGSPEGQRLLDRRLAKAVRTVCSAQSHVSGSRIMTPEYKACLTAARAAVRQQLAAITPVKQRGV